MSTCRRLALMAATLMVATPSLAQDFYQNKQITTVVGFSTGGAMT